MRFLIFFALILCLQSCSDDNKNPDSPFGDLLSKPPYASITDSISKMTKADELYFHRAVLLNKNNLTEPALADFRKAWSLAKEENYALGISNILVEKQLDSAILFLKSAIDELPQSIFLQLILARAYDNQNKISEALAVTNNILRLDSVQVNTLVLKSDLLQKSGDTTGALVALEQAYHIVPLSREVSNKLIYLYAENKNPKTLSIADTLISKDTIKQFPEPYYVKGVYYSNIKDQAHAIQWFNETIRIDHRFFLAYIEKGKILLDQKKTAEALKTFELINRISPAFPDAWYWMAQAQETLGQKEEARLNYEKAYSLDKTFVEAKEAGEKLEK